MERATQRPRSSAIAASTANTARHPHASATTVPTIIAAGMALSACNLGAWGALYAVSPEIYPTALRGTGSGSAAAFGRLASIIAPLAVPFFMTAGGSSLAFVAFGIAFVVAMVGALFLPEYRGAALEEE